MKNVLGEGPGLQNPSSKSPVVDAFTALPFLSTPSPTPICPLSRPFLVPCFPTCSSSLVLPSSSLHCEDIAAPGTVQRNPSCLCKYFSPKPLQSCPWISRSHEALICCTQNSPSLLPSRLITESSIALSQDCFPKLALAKSIATLPPALRGWPLDCCWTSADRLGLNPSSQLYQLCDLEQVRRLLWAPGSL